MVKDHNRITIVDIARQLNISAKSVSMGLNGTGRISSELRQRIHETARELNYRPNLAAKRLVTKQSYLIGVILPCVHNSFISHILAGIEEVAQREGIGVLLGYGSTDHATVEASVQKMLGYGVSGVIVMPLAANWQVYAEYLGRANLPVVQLMCHYPEISANYVEVNSIMASSMAVNHLIGLGHRNIGYISHEGDDLSMNQRSIGYKLALEAAGIDYRPGYVENSFHGAPEAYDATKTLLRRAPEITAVFAGSDYAAVGVLRAVLETGRRIPEDFSVIGFDDLEFSGMQAVLPLTTMAQPQDKIGTMGGELLLELMKGKGGNGISLSCELKVRATTARCRATARPRKAVRRTAASEKPRIAPEPAAV